jgi:diaminopimelate decarboxylase
MKYTIPDITKWGFDSDENNCLTLNFMRLPELTQRFGSPLYVVNEDRLERTASNFRNIVDKHFGNSGEVYYPFKCNSVKGIIEIIKESGFKAEVMTEYELYLALECGYEPWDIIVNGPSKSDAFLEKCINVGVKLIIVDSMSELCSLIRIAEENSVSTDILLRINPGVNHKGIVKNSRMGDHLSVFGMNSGEVLHALNYLKEHKSVRFKGIHFHIGTGITDAAAYGESLKNLYPLFGMIKEKGFTIEIIDTGGGYASKTSRELGAFELLKNEIIPGYEFTYKENLKASPSNFISAVYQGIHKYFGTNLPQVYFEPGRSIVSQNEFLLITVNRIKERDGKKWLITDAGLGTLTLPTYYEYHELILCNEVNRSKSSRFTITGPCCFSSDLIYKNKTMPVVYENEVLALMDCGAYFHSLESSFNFQRPAVVSIAGNKTRILRRREQLEDMIYRDILEKEVYHEI